MDEISLLIKSPVFWFSTVIVAFIISLAASYARDWLDDIRSRLSKYWKLKRIQDQEEFNRKVEELKSNKQLFNIYLADINFQKTRNILYYVVSYTTFFFALHNFANDNFRVAIVYGLVGFFAFVFPCQSTTLKIEKMVKVVRAVSGVKDKHFGH